MSRGDGGCSFAPDPDLRADQTVVFWRPELLADLIRLVPAAGTPIGTHLRFDPPRWPARCVMHVAEDGIHAIVAEPTGEHRLWLPGPEPPLGTPLAVMLDCDNYALERANAALRFWRFVAGPPAARSPPARQPASRAHRLAEMLWALDLRAAGRTQRELAATVLGSAPAADWADHSDRSHIRRLIRDAAAIVNTRYRDLLRPAQRSSPAVAR